MDCTQHTTRFARTNKDYAKKARHGGYDGRKETEMYAYNEDTKQFEEKPIKFKINGIESSDEDYLVSIPTRYVQLFEGHDFPSLEIFRLALMFASCASEAYYYNRPWVVEQDERSLMECLKK